MGSVAVATEEVRRGAPNFEIRGAELFQKTSKYSNIIVTIQIEAQINSHETDNPLNFYLLPLPLSCVTELRTGLGKLIYISPARVNKSHSKQWTEPVSFLGNSRDN